MVYYSGQVYLIGANCKAALSICQDISFSVFSSHEASHVCMYICVSIHPSCMVMSSFIERLFWQRWSTPL